MADNDNEFCFNKEKDQQMLRMLIDKEFFDRKKSFKGRHQIVWDSITDDICKDLGWTGLTGLQSRNRFNRLNTTFRKLSESRKPSGSMGGAEQWYLWTLVKEIESTCVMRDPVAQCSSNSIDIESGGEDEHDDDQDVSESPVTVGDCIIIIIVHTREAEGSQERTPRRRDSEKGQTVRFEGFEEV